MPDDVSLLTLVDAALRGMVLALAMLLATTLWRDRPRLPAARAGVAMTLGLCVQVVSSTPTFEALVPLLWQAPWVGVSVGNAVLFWIFVQALFDDEFTLRPVHVATWLGVAALSGLNCAVLAGSASVLAAVTLGLQRAVPLACAALAAVAAAAHWRADLVEPRRRLRGFILITGIAYTLAMLVARLASPHGRLSGITATADVSILLVMLSVVAARMLNLGASDLFPSLRSAMPPACSVIPVEVAPERAKSSVINLPLPSADAAEERLAQTLQRLMATERAYRTEDLTVTSLAARLAVPEYRLRRLINQRLGHRNFNAYVNGWRLEEARVVLADPARRELPVLSIALDAGFQSIGPFNRAFKAATGLTPSEFRQQELADS